MSNWNPRYLIFARCHSRSPCQQLMHDTRRWPGGRMTGYILWTREHVARFKTAHPEACVLDAANKRPIAIADQGAFTDWLMKNATSLELDPIPPEADVPETGALSS